MLSVGNKLNSSWFLTLRLLSLNCSQLPQVSNYESEISVRCNHVSYCNENRKKPMRIIQIDLYANFRTENSRTTFRLVADDWQIK